MKNALKITAIVSVLFALLYGCAKTRIPTQVTGDTATATASRTAAINTPTPSATSTDIIIFSPTVTATVTETGTEIDTATATDADTDTATPTVTTTSTEADTFTITETATATATMTSTMVCTVVSGYPDDNDNEAEIVNYLEETQIGVASDTLVTKIGIKLSQNSNYIAGIYSNVVAGNAPDTLLVSTGITAGTAGWNEVDINPVTLMGGTLYWLVVTAENQSIENNSFGTAGFWYTSYSWSNIISGGLPNSPAPGGYTGVGEIKNYVGECH